MLRIWEKILLVARSTAVTSIGHADGRQTCLLFLFDFNLDWNVGTNLSNISLQHSYANLGGGGGGEKKILAATARLQTPERCHSQFHIEHPQILGVVTVQHLLATATRRRGVCAPCISGYSAFLGGQMEEQIYSC